MWQWIGDRVPKESVWSVVQDAFDPLRSEVIGHDSVFKALEAWVLNLIETVIIEDRYEWMVISDHSEMRKARKEQLALGNSP